MLPTLIPACEPRRVLDVCTRVFNASVSDWSASLAKFAALPALELRAEDALRCMGSLSHLDTDQGSLTYLEIAQPCLILGRGGARFMLLLSLDGHVDFHRVDQPVPVSRNTADCIRPGQWLEVNVEHSARGLLVQFSPELLARNSRAPELTEAAIRKITVLLAPYLYQSSYFVHQQQAKLRTGQLIEQIWQCLTSNSHSAAIPTFSGPDARIERIATFIRGEEEWLYNLKELANLAHTSQRNLYRLMKSHIGHTPYRYHQRCRLLRVHDDILRQSTNASTVAAHATNHGFFHLGRFSAVYNELFGELPSATLGRVQGLPDLVRTLKEAGVLRIFSGKADEQGFVPTIKQPQRDQSPAAN